MLSEKLFKENFYAANRLKGVEVSAVELGLAYKVCKEKFTDAEFISITEKVIEECRAYGRVLDIAEWFSRKKAPTNLEILIARYQEQPENEQRKETLTNYCKQHRFDNDVEKYLEQEKTLLLTAKEEPSEHGNILQFIGGNKLKRIG